MQPAETPWTGRADVLLRGVGRTPRTIDILDLAWVDRVRKAPHHVAAAAKSSKFDMLKHNFFCDHSQQNARKPWGNLRVLTTSSALYSFELDRNLLPEEHLVLQGHALPNTSGWDHSEVKALADLAGEGMCLPVLASALYALVLAVPFPGLFETAPTAGRSSRLTESLPESQQ